MTSPFSLGITYGSANATPVVGNVSCATLVVRKFVTLAVNYVRSVPPGYPDPNPGINQTLSQTAFPTTILSGSRVLFFEDEADALVAAGAGSYS